MSVPGQEGSKGGRQDADRAPSRARESGPGAERAREMPERTRAEEERAGKVSTHRRRARLSADLDMPIRLDRAAWSASQQGPDPTEVALSLDYVYARNDSPWPRPDGATDPTEASAILPESPSASRSPSPHQPSAPSGDEQWLSGPGGPLSGRSIGTLRIGALVRHGALGASYRALDIAHERRVCAVALAPALSTEPTVSARVVRLAIRVTRIDSLHVLRLHGVEAQAGVMVLAFEAADGADLATALAGAPQRDEGLGGHRALAIVIQAARAPTARARAGFIHGRLTPAHLLIGRDGTVKVDGIGLIHAAPTWVGDHGVEPTPYSAPEQVRGLGDIRSDLFSLGAIFYEMLTGHLPFGKGIHLSAHERPPLPQTIDSGVGDHQQRMVMRLLERDPAARIQHPDELIAVLDPDYAPITAPRVEPVASAAPPPVPLATPSWIVRALVAGIALATVATLATIAVPKLRSGDSAEIAQLRRALTVLDQPKAIPPWAEHDLDELALVRGDQDPDVARWRAKLALWRTLQQALGDLDRPGAPTRTSAETADLLRDYVALVGADDPEVARWRAKLAQAASLPSGR